MFLRFTMQLCVSHFRIISRRGAETQREEGKSCRSGVAHVAQGLVQEQALDARRNPTSRLAAESRGANRHEGLSVTPEHDSPRELSR